MVSANPNVLALRAALEDAHGRVDQAERWYAAVLERVDHDVAFRVAVATRYALVLYHQGRFEAIRCSKTWRCETCIRWSRERRACSR